MFAAHSLPRGTNYDEGADKSLTVLVQIESRSGVDNVEEIAKVEGIDVLFIGKSTDSSHLMLSFRIYGVLTATPYSIYQAPSISLSKLVSFEAEKNTKL